MSKEYRFNPGDFVVYPTHGVGKVVDITQSEVGGQKLELIAVNFDKERMTMRIPMTNVGKTNLRPLSSREIMDSALESLKGKPKIKKTMWSRRSQEYDAKINSGDPCQIAEVVRDLNKPLIKVNNHTANVKCLNTLSADWFTNMLHAKESISKKQQAVLKTFYKATVLL